MQTLRAEVEAAKNELLYAAVSDIRRRMKMSEQNKRVKHYLKKTENFFLSKNLKKLITQNFRLHFNEHS
jgi:hypothetical protein